MYDSAILCIGDGMVNAIKSLPDKERSELYKTVYKSLKEVFQSDEFKKIREMSKNKTENEKK